MQEKWRKLINWIGKALEEPGDTENILSRKVLAVLVIILGSPMYVGSIIFSFQAGLMLTAGLNALVLISTIASLAFLFQTRRFTTFVHLVLFQALAYMLGIQITWKTIIQSDIVLLTGMIIPLAAALLLNQRSTIWWTIIYFVTSAIALSVEIDPPQLPFSFPPNWIPINVMISIVIITSGSVAMTLYLVRGLETAQARADALLLNILPQEIAQVLKHDNRSIVDHIEQVSIMFADVVDFTPMSATMSPTELVSLLNEVFSQFDTLVDKYHLEKIKTIGDCYMVAAGVPRPRPDHAQAIARLALDMQAYVSQNDIQGRKLQFRIGINSGPVVAGVIGRRKFIYDLWGDAVNTASRMESHGAGGIIQITQSTYDLIKHDFVCKPHGRVSIKGKGEMDVWQIINHNA